MQISILPTLALLAIGTGCAVTSPAGRSHSVQDDTGQAGGHSGYDDIADFGGPSSVGEQLEEDDAVRPENEQSSFEAFKQRQLEERGLAFGMDYTGAYFNASDSLGEDEAAAGMFRLFGSWTLTGRDDPDRNGSLVFKVEHRHDLGTDVVPFGLGFETGYAGLVAPIYGEQDFMLSNLYWRQELNGGRLNFIGGIVDTTDYLDIYGLINPWTAFSNLEFLTNPTIPAPNMGLGAAFGTMIGDRMYLVGGIADANGDPTEQEDAFDSFFDDGEYFTHLELGWTSDYDRRYFDNTHLTLWHADEREDAQVVDGWGAAFSFARFVNDTWMPFVRAGYADDGGSILETSLTGGVGYYMPERGNLLGFGLGVGEPNESSFGPGLDEQYTAELFYRMQVTEQIAITPDLQLLIDPALNPSEDQIVVLGVRMRLAL